MGDGASLLLGNCVALAAIVLYALSDSLALIFGLNALRGFSFEWFPVCL